MSARLNEVLVSDAFHSYLKSSLYQAEAQRLLDTDLLSSAEADLMIAGPALCLYFAALRCTTSPPSVPLPRTGKSFPGVDLTPDNCPVPFISFLQVWSRNVPEIQRLSPEHQHDLARIICGLEPAASPLHPQISRIAAELRAVAIEISQRRTFQDRYASDLQAAIDGGGAAGPGDLPRERAGRPRVLASFVPPPEYEPSPSPSPSRSPNSTAFPLPPTSPSHSTFLQPPMSPKSSSYPSVSRSRTPSPASPAASDRFDRSPPSFASESPAIQLIRETLYASLADVLVSHRYVQRLLQRDPPRAYFASVA
ncbi:hypothetical protein EW145_g8098, partial [Phellinidium pouzarii]